MNGEVATDTRAGEGKGDKEFGVESDAEDEDEREGIANPKPIPIRKPSVPCTTSPFSACPASSDARSPRPPGEVELVVYEDIRSDTVPNKPDRLAVLLVRLNDTDGGFRRIKELTPSGEATLAVPVECSLELWSG